MKKDVGWGKDRDYNLNLMCCRISTTGFATRTIAGLYIFLATFLMGFAAVCASSWLGKITLSESDGSKLRTLVQAPYEADICRNNYGIVFSRWHWAPDGKAGEVIFGVSNAGSQTIYLERNELRVDYWKLGAGPYSYTRTFATFAQKPILVGHMFRFPDEPQIKIQGEDMIPFSFTSLEDFEANVSLEFRTNDAEPYREITAHFKRGENSPDSCH
jgi:hypothetical protein